MGRSLLGGSVFSRSPSALRSPAPSRQAALLGRSAFLGRPSSWAGRARWAGRAAGAGSGHRSAGSSSARPVCPGAAVGRSRRCGRSPAPGRSAPPGRRAAQRAAHRRGCWPAPERRLSGPSARASQDLPGPAAGTASGCVAAAGAGDGAGLARRDAAGMRGTPDGAARPGCTCDVRGQQEMADRRLPVNVSSRRRLRGGLRARGRHAGLARRPALLPAGA